MDSNISKRQEIYNQAPKDLQELYGSDLTTKAIKKAVEAIGLRQEPAYGNFVRTIGDVILGLYSKNSLDNLLRERFSLSDQQLAAAREALGELLNELPEATEKETFSNVIKPNVYVPPTQPTTTDESNSATTKTTKDNTTKEGDKVQAVRTFAKDVEWSRAHGYGAFRSNPETKPEENDDVVHSSNQDDVLGKK